MTGQQATEHRVMCLLGPVTVELSTDEPAVVDYPAEFYPITTTVSGKPDWVVDARVGPGGGMRRNAYGVAYAADPGVRTVVVRADDPLNLAMTTRKTVRDTLVAVERHGQPPSGPGPGGEDLGHHGGQPSRQRSR